MIWKYNNNYFSSSGKHLGAGGEPGLPRSHRDVWGKLRKQEVEEKLYTLDQCLQNVELCIISLYWSKLDLGGGTRRKTRRRKGSTRGRRGASTRFDLLKKVVNISLSLWRGWSRTRSLGQRMIPESWCSWSAGRWSALQKVITWSSCLVTTWSLDHLISRAVMSTTWWARKRRTSSVLKRWRIYKIQHLQICFQPRWSSSTRTSWLGRTQKRGWERRTISWTREMCLKILNCPLVINILIWTCVFF